MKKLRLAVLVAACVMASFGSVRAAYSHGGTQLCDCGSMVCDNDFVWSAWYEDGLYRIDKATLQVDNFTAKDLGIGSGIIPDVAVDPNDGSLWLTSKTIRIYNLKDGVLTHIDNPGVAQNYLHTRFSPSGVHWVFTPNSIMSYIDNSWRGVSLSNCALVVMSNWYYRNLAWDDNGDLWAVTCDAEYAVLHFSNYALTDIYSIDFVEEEYYKSCPLAVAGPRDGKLLITTRAKIILFDLESRTFSTFDYCEEADGGMLTCAQYDQNGLAWLAGQGIVSTFDGEKNEKVNIEGLEEGEKVISLLPDGDDVWLATDKRNFYLLRNGEVLRTHAGIEDMVIDSSATATDSKIYNLQGQRVVNPVKGSLYIQDGKKVIW